MSAMLQCLTPFPVAQPGKGAAHAERRGSSEPKTKRVEYVSEPFAYEALLEELMVAVKRICPAWLSAHHDDLVQAGMMRIMDVVDKTPDGKIPARAYIRKVAYSAMVDEMRRRKRLAETQIEDGEGEPMPISTDDPCPETRLEGSLIGGAIRECMLRLVTPRRLTVALHLKGHSVPEASRLLGWTPKKTENLVYRGLADLRSCLTSKGVRP